MITSGLLCTAMDRNSPKQALVDVLPQAIETFSIYCRGKSPDTEIAEMFARWGELKCSTLAHLKRITYYRRSEMKNRLSRTIRRSGVELIWSEWAPRFEDWH